MHPGWRKNYLRYKSYFLNVAGQYRQRADIKVYLEILLSLATVTIFSVFALRPTLLTIAELIKEIETKNDVISVIDSKIQDLSKAQLLSDQQRANLSLLHIAIPQKPSPDIFMRQVEVLSQKYQTSLTGFTIGEALILGESVSKTSETGRSTDTPKPESTSEKLTFSIQTKVDIDNFTNSADFLNDIEISRRPIQINSFNFNSVEDAQEGGKDVIFTIAGTLPFLEFSN